MEEDDTAFDRETFPLQFNVENDKEAESDKMVIKPVNIMELAA